MCVCVCVCACARVLCVCVYVCVCMLPAIFSETSNTHNNHVLNDIKMDMEGADKNVFRFQDGHERCLSCFVLIVDFGSVCVWVVFFKDRL